MRCRVSNYIELKGRQARVNILGSSSTIREYRRRLLFTRASLAFLNKIASLEKHGVYALVTITSVTNGQKVVGARWVYKIKTDGVYKGRLVVLRWSQVPGIDCGGTFVPVCSLQSIRSVLAIAAELDTRSTWGMYKQHFSTLT